jgi:hypothetical protein
MVANGENPEPDALLEQMTLELQETGEHLVYMDIWIHHKHGYRRKPRLSIPQCPRARVPS